MARAACALFLLLLFASAGPSRQQGSRSISSLRADAPDPPPRAEPSARAPPPDLGTSPAFGFSDLSAADATFGFAPPPPPPPPLPPRAPSAPPRAVDTPPATRAEAVSVARDGTTPLMAAADACDDEGVLTLLAAGADPRSVTVSGATALHFAACGPVARVLVDAGADVEAGDLEGVTPLMTAALGDHSDVVRFLLREAIVDAVDFDGSTALLWASTRGCDASVAALLAAGADANFMSRDGWTPLSGAAFGGHVEVVRELLVARAEVEKRGRDGATPLMTAASLGHLDVVEELLTPKVVSDDDTAVTTFGSHFVPAADVHARSVGGDEATSLMLASAHGHVDTVATLLAAGAEVDAVSAHGATALHFASSSGSVDVVHELLSAGASPNVRDNDGSMPIAYAAASGHVEVVFALAHGGADVNARGRTGSAKGWTPLHLAAANGHEPVVRALLELNADVKARTPGVLWGFLSRKSALDLAREAQHADVVALLTAKAPPSE